MADIRRDCKGRILRNGEVQRADGKYMYRYTDNAGERQTVYSWKLVESDRVPADRRCGPALRTMIEQIEKDLIDGIRTNEAAKLTLNDFFDLFMDTRHDLKESTRCNYLCLYNTHVRDSLGAYLVKNIRYSDIQKFYFMLSRDHDLRVSSIRAINSIIWQILDTATRDDFIRKNPSEGVMREVAKKLKEEAPHRSALTVQQQKRFIDYIRKSRYYSRYSNLFVVLLGTGMRIGEMLGLRWCDVDFKKDLIHINHSLSYKETEKGGYQYRINSTKTNAGLRTVPMFQDVRDALQKEKRKKKNPEWKPFVVDGYSGFIFLNANGKVYTPSAIFDKIQSIVEDYNRQEASNAYLEHRDPVLIPKISAHILRHTFCTRLCESGANIKVVQSVMGHKNIRTTMDVYNEATAEAKAQSFAALEGAVYLG